MKNFCVIHILLFFLMMLIYKLGNAQDYVVTLKGDTVRGTIRIFSFGPEKKVQVVTSDKKKNTFPIFQVRSFVKDDENYSPVKGPDGYAFMKVLKEGYLTLYAFQRQNQVNYDGQYLLKKDGSGIEVPNLTFKKTIVKYLSECSDVTAKIENGDLSKTDIEKIVEEYNACISANSARFTNSLTRQKEQSRKISAWDVLEEKVSAKTDFEGKTDALDMITEIKNKIKKQERVPNFMIEGLKSSLKDSDLSAELQNAISELN